MALEERVQAAFREGEEQRIGGLLATASDHSPWEHARRILSEELGIADVVAGLRQLPEMLQRIARSVEFSKAKDDQRGARIIEDYAQVHAEADQDLVVRQTWTETRRLQHEIEESVMRLERERTRRSPLEKLTA